MYDIDLSDVDTTTVESMAAAGGMVPPGKYHARLDGASDITSKRTGNAGVELEYELLAGPFAGTKVKDTVWLPVAGDDPVKAAKAKNRFFLIGHRLGLLKPNPKGRGYVMVDCKEGFGDCLGKECVIEVTHRKWQSDDGREGVALNVTYGGVFALDSKEAKGVPLAKPGGGGGGEPASGGTATATKPRTRVEDL